MPSVCMCAYVCDMVSRFRLLTAKQWVLGPPCDYGAACRLSAPQMELHISLIMTLIDSIMMSNGVLWAFVVR